MGREVAKAITSATSSERIAGIASNMPSSATLDGMAELGDFLRSRRARLQPQDVGLPDHGRRRVPGLRREERMEFPAFVLGRRMDVLAANPRDARP